jgi:transposase
MRQRSGTSKDAGREGRQRHPPPTRKQHSAEEKIRIVLEGLRGEESIAELCRREGIADEPLLQLVEGVPRGRQEAAGG